jgi:hypothetical protein
MRNIRILIIGLPVLGGSLKGYSQADSTENPLITNVLSIVKSVEDKAGFIDQLSPDSNVVLPIGLIRKIGVARYIIAIDSCKFRPDGAYLNAYAAIDFPGPSGKKIAFEGKNIKFNPKGVVGGDQAKLVLVSDHSIKISDMVTLKLKNDGRNWVEWDCNGFKAINLKGYFEFSKGKLLPDTTMTNEKVVTASFEIYTTDLSNFIAQTTITPFMVEGLKNWSFEVNSATVDMSELVNAGNMSFPAGYSNPNNVTPEMWTGFYLQSLKVTLPKEISKSGKRTQISVSNLLIDNMGVTGMFQANNVYSTSEGSMNGWGFSLDEIGVSIICNNITGGHLKGKVLLPIDSTSALNYSATVNYNPTSKETDYAFIISPANNLKFDVFSAKINLNSSSQITVVKENGKLKPTAILNGDIRLDNKNASTNGGGLAFENLTIISQAPYITSGVFSFVNSTTKTTAANYPIVINNLTLGINQGVPILGLGVTLNISDDPESGFSVTTGIKVKGKIESQQVNYTDDYAVSYTKSKWSFDKATIDAIAIDVKTAPFKLKGTVLFKDNDPVYGDGFMGSIEFSLDKVLPNPAAVSACFGAKSTYRYFYVDAVIPVNIPLGTIPISLNKLMGGLYYHMRPQNATQAELIAASKNQTSVMTNALSYVPDNTISIGLKAGVGYQYTTSAKAANGDVMLEVAFTSSGGLGFVKLAGDIYIMAEPADRVKAPIKGNILVTLDAENQVFDAAANINVNAYNAITGSGSAKFHIEPGLWYLAVGRPTQPLSLNLMNIVQASAYFMVGNSIEQPANPPSEVLAIVGNAGLNDRRDGEKLATGSGFCAGARISAQINKEFGWDSFSVYGGFNFGAGFDMMLMNFGPNAHCSGSSDKVGMNGWLASGSMYIYVQGQVGIKGEYLGKDFNFKIMDVGVAAIVQGKLPKPVYLYGALGCQYNVLGGLVKGSFTFDYEYGSNCIPVSGV